MTAPPIKVGFLVSYDWYLLYNALPQVYDQADCIYLALDKKRLTWSGNHFNFDEVGFQQMLNKLDTKNKIKVYEDDFYQHHLTPMQCEVRERNLLAKALGEGGWHIQLDADEYFLNFDAFVSYIRQLSSQQKPFNVCVSLINLFKKVEKGYLHVALSDKQQELVQVATTLPHYDYGRKNGYFNHISPFFMLHDTWARSPEEVWQKISNWGHKADFDTEHYFNFWKGINQYNYQSVENFHPIRPSTWQKLALLEGDTIDEVIERIPSLTYPLSKFQLYLKNNRNLARLKSLWFKLFQ
ncbi:MAG: hypothetical protein ACFB0B_14285 [Thermonemataceae bacterium]